MTLKKGDKGAAVLALQNLVLALGEHLPRFGADSQLGDETLAAVDHALSRISTGLPVDNVITQDEIEMLQNLLAQKQDANIKFPTSFLACTSEHPLPRPQHCRPRPWGQIDSIVLHQTACVLGEEPRRWFSIPIHVGVTRSGLVLWLNRFDVNLPHANGFNSRSIGIEIDGAFAGVEGDKKTFWQGGEIREPQTITPAQIASCREAIEWIVGICAANGAYITNILAHRQSSKDRVSDPGSKVWQDVALWAEEKLGLKAGGLNNLTVTGGRPIPKEWDSRSSEPYL
jgi:hypothetical protein